MDTNQSNSANVTSVPINYRSIIQPSFCNKHFCYIDTGEYLADTIFIKHGIKVHHEMECDHPDTPYHIIICYVRKQDTGKFNDAMRELKDKMIICGHTDYAKACSDIWKILQDAGVNGK